MLEVITRPLLLRALDEVAYASDAVTKQLKALYEFAAEDVYPPLPARDGAGGYARAGALRHVRRGGVGNPGIRH